MPDIVCGDFCWAVFCIGAGRTGVVIAQSWHFLLLWLSWVCSGLELAGYLLVSPLQPHTPTSPLDCLLLLVFPVCSLCWLTGRRGRVLFSLSVLGGPWALGTCLSPGGSVMGVTGPAHPLVSTAVGRASKQPAGNDISVGGDSANGWWTDGHQVETER